MKRIFLAIDLPKDIKKNLREKLKEINSGNWREIDHDNLHITLIFFGNLTDEKLKRLIESFKQIKLERFEIKISEIVRKKDMLWANIRESASLESLYEELKDKSRFLDLEDHRRFTPHITLAKTKKKFQMPKMLLNLDFSIDRITLYESKIDHRGSKYYPILKIRAK